MRVARERTTAHHGRSRGRGAWHVRARPHGRGARTSPRSCREHSRERDRGSRGHGARPPCSATCRPLRALHRASRDGASPSCGSATVFGCVPTSRPSVGRDGPRRRRGTTPRPTSRRARRLAPRGARRARQDRGERHDARRLWFAPATWRTPWRVSRLPSARRSKARCPCRVSARRRGRGLAPRDRGGRRLEAGVTGLPAMLPW